VPHSEQPPRSRWVAVLGDLHFWIPFAVFVAGMLLLRWLP
jgi:hypothetical protein